MLILIGIGLFNISAHFQKGNDTPGILFSLNGEIQTHGNALGGIGLASGQSNVLTREVAAFAQNGNTDGGYKASLAPRPVGDSGLASDTGSAGDTGIVSGPGAPGDPGLAGGPARTTSDAVERGLAMIGNGEIASGIAVLEAVSQRQNGLDSLAWKTLLQTYFSHDLMAAYEDCIGRYLQANPDDLEEWVNLAKVQYDRQAFVAASRSILKALNRDPNHQRANFLMGTIYRELGLPEEALPYLNRALKTDPLNTEFNREVAAAYIEIKDLKSARRHLERAMSVTVNAGTRDEEAERLMAQLENQEKLELPAYGQATLSDPVSIGAPEMELPKISGDPVMGGSTVAVSGSHPGMGGKVLYEAPDWNPEGVRVTIPPTVRKSRDVSARALTIDVTRENTSSPTKFGNQDPEVGIHPAIPATQTTSANSANSANSATPKTSVPTPTISATPQTSATSTITVTPTTPETSATIAIPTTSPTLASLANPATAATTATVIPNPLEHVFSEFVGKAFPGAASNSASNSSAIAVAPVAGHEETVSGIHEAEKRKSAALEKPPAPVLPDGSGRPPTPLAIAASSSEKIGEGSAKGSNKASAKGSDEGSAKGSTKGSSKGSAGGSSADSDESLSNFFVGYPERNGRGAGSGSEDLANSVAIEDRKAERGKKPTTAGLKPRAESTKAAGKASADDNLKRLWAKGFENYLAGRWEQALPSFLSYLEKREDPRAYDMVGIIFEKLKLEHDSFDAVMSAYRLGQKDPQTLVRIGLLAEKIGNFSKGVEFLEQAKAKLPHRVDLKIHLARCYKGSGNSAEAREILRKVVADPQQSYAVKRSAELDLALIDKPGSR